MRTIGLLGLLGWMGCNKDEAAPSTFVVVTFNTGTSTGLPHDQAPDDGYDSDDAARSDAFYGNGLAWLPAIEATRTFFDQLQPDIITFQEIFWSGDCPGVPASERSGFACEGWDAASTTVVQDVLGEGWQVACHPGKPDKCAAVHERFGRFKGCVGDFCLEGLDGGEVDGCGSGARVARGLIERTDGTLLTLVNVHGSSGVTKPDQACRVKQVEQVFIDLGDGEPAANGLRNIVLGDLNTDPGRWADSDESAARWLDFVGDGLDYQFISPVGPDAPRTYAGLADIDHVMSDTFSGDCWSAGSGSQPAVTDAVYFDHLPLVCTLQDP